MNPFDIFIAYVSWGSGGKRRPILVYKINGGDVTSFPVTTQYANKPKAIQSRYFAIDDWAQAGLDKQSFVDTGTPYIFSESAFRNAEPIGRLTENDKHKFIEFFAKQG